MGRPPIEHPDIGLIIALYDAGMTANEVGKYVSLTKSGVMHHLKKHNIKRHNKGNPGDTHPFWKGQDASLNSIHRWVKKKLPKPELCDNCNASPPYDLANIADRPNPLTYNRDVNNWSWLCRHCHMTEDGRVNNLKQYREIVHE